MRAECELKLVLTLGINIRYVQVESWDKGHDPSANLSWALHIKILEFAPSYVLPCCFSVFVFLMDSGKTRCYGFILLLFFQGHNLPSKSMPGNKYVCLNFKFDTGDIMWNSEKKIFWIHTKNLQDIYWEKNRFNLPHTNISFTPISVLEKNAWRPHYLPSFISKDIWLFHEHSLTTPLPRIDICI